MKKLLVLLIALLSVLTGCGATEAGSTGDMTCMISISCENLISCEVLTDEKRELVPKDGWILAPVQCTFSKGESVFDVLYRIVRENKIHMEYEKTPAYNSVYIEGIGNLYEFDAGPQSGWMFSVNGEFPNYGCSSVTVQDGDVVEWAYTCDLGNDLGRSMAVQ